MGKLGGLDISEMGVLSRYIIFYGDIIEMVAFLGKIM